MRKLLFTLTLVIGLIALCGLADAATVTASFNKTYTLVNGTTEYINLTYLQSVSDAYVTFYVEGGSTAAFDNDGGGTWTNYISIPVTTTPAQYAQYKVVITSSSLEVYAADGTQKLSDTTSGVWTDFWANVKSDGSDIRVFNQSLGQLYFWVETFNYTTQTTTIWVNLTAGSTELNIAYGNPSATKSTYENGFNVFEFFDDFERPDNTVVGNGWVEDYDNSFAIVSGQLELKGTVAATNQFCYNTFTRSGKLAYYAKMKQTANENHVIFGVPDLTNTYAWKWNMYYVGDKVYLYNSGWVSVEPADTNWHVLGIIVDLAANTADYILDGVTVATAQSPYAQSVPGDIFLQTYDTVGLGYVEWVFVAKLTDPATFGTPTTENFQQTATNPCVSVNGNNVCYTGVLNSTNPSSGQILIDSAYWIDGLNSLYFSADSGNYNSIVSLNYTLNVTEQRIETYEYLTINTTFTLETGTVTAVWETSFTTSYNYSVKVYVNGTVYSNFIVTEAGSTKTITVNLTGLEGKLNVYVYVNFAATTIYVTVLDELAKTGINSTTVELVDNNYNLIVTNTTNVDGQTVLNTVYFGDAFIKVRDAAGVYRQVYVNVPNGGTLNVTVYFPTQNILQITFNIIDYIGEFSNENSRLIIKKYISRDELVVIHEDKPDLQNHVQAYLILSENYEVLITNGVTTISLGWFKPSSSGTINLYVKITEKTVPLSTTFANFRLYPLSNTLLTGVNTICLVVDPKVELIRVEMVIYNKTGVVVAETNASNVVSSIELTLTINANEGDAFLVNVSIDAGSYGSVAFDKNYVVPSSVGLWAAMTSAKSFITTHTQTTEENTSVKVLLAAFVSAAVAAGASMTGIVPARGISVLVAAVFTLIALPLGVSIGVIVVVWALAVVAIAVVREL